jgi:hypothetical protein
MVVGAFESLITTRIGGLTANFKRRLPMVAQMVSLGGVDEEFAERIYEARSEGVHGSAVGLFSNWGPEAQADVRRAIMLLRRTLRVAVLNESFADQFRDKESIDRLFGRQTVPVYGP